MECDYIGLYDSKHLFYYNSINVLDIITNTNELFHSISYSSLFDINDASYKVYTISLFLNRIYVLLLSQTPQISFKAFILDLPSKNAYNILLPEEVYQEISSKISLCKFTYVLEQNKIFLIGGIMQDNKHIQKSIFTFDISLYSFMKEKYTEFTLIPRYRHSCTSQNGIIYVIGGFTSYPESDTIISNEVQFGKYDNSQLHKFNIVKIEGEKPEMMIDANIKIVNDRYVIAFSAYKYSKIWIMDTKDNKGKNYDLRKESFEDYNDENIKINLIQNDITDEGKKINLCIAIIDKANKKINTKYLILNL